MDIPTFSCRRHGHFIRRRRRGGAAAQRPWAGEVDGGKPRRILDNPSSRTKLRNQQEDALVQRLLAHRRRNSPRKRPAAKPVEGADAATG